MDTIRPGLYFLSNDLKVGTFFFFSHCAVKRITGRLFSATVRKIKRNIFWKVCLSYIGTCILLGNTISTFKGLHVR